jgi:hypothetical protein
MVSEGQPFEVEADFQFLDIKSNLSNAGKKMKNITKLQQEFEILSYQMFFGVSNKDIKASGGVNLPTTDSEEFELAQSHRHNHNELKFDKSGTRVKGPANIRALFNDANELFLKFQKAEDLDFSRSDLDFHHQKLLEHDLLEIQ